MQAPRRPFSRAALFALLLIVPGASAQTRPVACPGTHDFNFTDYESYSGGGAVYINKIPFDFHIGTLDWLSFAEGSSSGTYSFSNIVSEDGRWVFEKPTLGAYCFESGYWVIPMTDTLWTLSIAKDAQPGGTVAPLYEADGNAQTTNGGTVTECDYLVAADQNGNPILDDDGNYVIVEDLGCHDLLD